jgi:hypothetical protein
VNVNNLAAGDTETVSLPLWTPSPLGEVFDLTAVTELSGDLAKSSDTLMGRTYSYFSQRKIMAEMFTCTSCSPCVAANDSMNRIYNDLEDSIVLIRYHVWWPTNNDPFYLNLGGDTMDIRQRRTYYGLNFVPYVVVGGVVVPASNSAYYRQNINDMRQGAVSPLMLTMGGSYDSSSNSGQVAAAVYSTGRVVDSDLRLFYMIIQDSILYTGTNGDTIHHQVYRQVLPSMDGRIININMGETLYDTVSFSIPTAGYNPAYAEGDCRIIAFVQDNITKSILQVVRIPLLSLLTGAQHVPDRPTVGQSVLMPCYPNPSAGDVNISYNLSSEGMVRLAVYDISGRLVRSLVNGRLKAGKYDVKWDIRNDSGSKVSNGVYFYKLEAAGFSATRKIAVLK